MRNAGVCGTWMLAVAVGISVVGGARVGTTAPGVPRTILCLGDSNTAAGWPTAGTPRWCEHAQKLAPPAWRFVNFGIGGGRVTRGPRSGHAVDRDVWTGHFWLRRALREVRPDVVVLAYGTNDVRRGAVPEDIVAAYEALAAKARRAGACPLVALTPPMVAPEEDRATVLGRLNALLRARFGPANVIDFASDFTAADLDPDGVHVNATGQHRRAAVAIDTLRRLDVEACRDAR